MIDSRIGGRMKSKIHVNTCEVGLNGARVCLFAIVIGCLQEGENAECGAGRCPMPRAAPATVTAIREPTKPTGLSGRRTRDTANRRPAADGYQLVRRRVDGRGIMGLRNYCCSRQQLLFGMRHVDSRRRHQVPTDPSRGGQLRTPHQPVRQIRRPPGAASRALTAKNNPGSPTPTGLRGGGDGDREPEPISRKAALLGIKGEADGDQQIPDHWLTC